MRRHSENEMQCIKTLYLQLRQAHPEKTLAWKRRRELKKSQKANLYIVGTKKNIFPLYIFNV
jgi:hypothetical protein